MSKRAFLHYVQHFLKCNFHTWIRIQNFKFLADRSMQTRTRNPVYYCSSLSSYSAQIQSFMVCVLSPYPPPPLPRGIRNYETQPVLLPLPPPPPPSPGNLRRQICENYFHAGQKKRWRGGSGTCYGITPGGPA
jgi:hypothetical protein